MNGTQIVLQPNQFVIQLDKDGAYLMDHQKEDFSLKLINPHADGDYDSLAYTLLKMLLTTAMDVTRQAVKDLGQTQQNQQA